MAQQSKIERTGPEKTTCKLMLLPAELRINIYLLVFNPHSEPVELVDVRFRDYQIIQTCRFIYAESKEAFDAASPAGAAYWSRDFNLTTPFNPNALTSRVPDWCFAHITGLHIRSRALACDLQRRGEIWFGYISWTKFNKLRNFHPDSDANCLLVVMDDPMEPAYYLAEIFKFQYEDLRDRGIVPTMTNGDTPARLTTTRLLDLLRDECCDDLLLPTGSGEGPKQTGQRLVAQSAMGIGEGPKETSQSLVAGLATGSGEGVKKKRVKLVRTK